MNKISTLILHILNKAKGQYISFGVFICLTAFIINIALVLAFQTFNAYDSLFDELDTADINFIIPQIQDNKELLTEVEKIDGVSFVEKHGGVFTPVTVREFAGSDFDMNTVFYNLDEERTLNLLDVTEYSGKSEVSVYIPMYMKELGGFAEGGNIAYSIDGKEHTYNIGGIVLEMQYGNYGTGLIGGYFPGAVYEDFAQEYSDQVIAEYSLKTTSTADLSEIKNNISEILREKGIALLSINDKDTSKQTRTMVCTLLIVIFLALADIIFEYDGDAEQVMISDNSGSLELTAKTDYEITVDKITGRLDINQWKAKAVIHIPEENIVNVINKGRKCNVYYVKEGKAAECENVADSENEISISGIFSEMVVDLVG